MSDTTRSEKPRRDTGPTVAPAGTSERGMHAASATATIADEAALRGRLPGLAGRAPDAGSTPSAARSSIRGRGSDITTASTSRSATTGRSRGPRRAARTACTRSRAGRVRQALRGLGPWKEGVIRLGHFGYGHVDPVVAEGDQVEPGQMIGLDDREGVACPSERVASPGRRLGPTRAGQPARSGGKLAPVRRHGAAGHPRHSFHDPCRSGVARRPRPSDLQARRHAIEPTRLAGSSTSVPGSRIRCPSEAGFATRPSSRRRTTPTAST